MDQQTQQDLINYLRGFATEARWENLQEKARYRTRHLSVVVEDVYQPHNASAVLRSCEGFGIQDVHIIENQHEFAPISQVTIGAEQWLSIHRYNQPKKDNTAECFAALKKDGYKIIATTPHEEDTNLNDLDISGKTALVFGSEIDGVSDRAMELADGFVKIPMHGFSESFNISVSAAICLYDLTLRLHQSDIAWELSAEEIEELSLEWLLQSIRAGEELKKSFLENRK